MTGKTYKKLLFTELMLLIIYFIGSNFIQNSNYTRLKYFNT